jgi:hypothetical protein
MSKVGLWLKVQTRLVADGDSLSAPPALGGAAGVTNWPELYTATAPKSVSLYNHAIGGDTLVANIAPTISGVDDKLYPPWRNIYALWPLTNDIQHAVLTYPGDVTSQLAYMNNTVLPTLISVLDGRRALGFKVICFTPADLSGIFSIGAACNVLRAAAVPTLRSWLGVHYDALVDLAADRRLGPDGVAAGSPDFLQDGSPHLTQAGQNHVAFDLFAPVCNPLL